LDIISLDEAGQWSAEDLCIMDIVLRYVQHSDNFLGGVLLFCTLDILQLLPITGYPFLMSSHMLTSFKFAALNESVHAGRDPHLHRIQKITQFSTSQLTPKIKKEFRNLIITKCSHVGTFADPNIPRTALCIVGRRNACQTIRDACIKQLLSTSTMYLVSRAVDEEKTYSSLWLQAMLLTTKKLERKTREPGVLYLFAKGIYEITYIK